MLKPEKDNQFIFHGPEGPRNSFLQFIPSFKL
jgi:hypothetical protein